MTEDETKALASEFEHNATWRVTDVFYLDGGNGFEGGWNVHLELCDGSAPGYGIVIDDLRQMANLRKMVGWLRKQQRLTPHAS